MKRTRSVQRFLPNHKIDGIILSGRWKPAQYAALPATAELLTRLVPNVIILGPNIEHGAELPLILGANSGLSAEDLGQLARSMVREKEQNVTAEMARILAGTGVDFVPLFPHVCGERACRVFSDTGEPLMFDRGHFTRIIHKGGRVG